MSFLDFIKNRQEQRPVAEQQSTQQKPETAKQMYTREAAQEKASATPVESVRPEEHVLFGKAKDLYRQGTHQAVDSPAANAPAAPEGATARQPMAQMSMSQDNAAPSLTPTSAQAGTRANEQEVPSPSTENPGPAQSKSQEQAKQTMARRPPSWER